MRIGIYVRRSTEEHQADSLSTQESEARRWIERKGWSVASTEIFSDSGVSRAEFVKRTGLLALQRAVEQRRIDTVVVRDGSRIGGDMHRTGIVIQDVLDSGARLFFYFTDEEVTLDRPETKLVMMVRACSDEWERVKISGRVQEHLQVKARKGFNVGGRVYGYDNLGIFEGTKRLRVEYRVNEEQKAIVREVFRRSAAGEGVRAIVKSFNERGVLSPRAGKRGTGSWSPSVIHSMLRNERYCGMLI
jgi:site-specific DNA recombinase